MTEGIKREEWDKENVRQKNFTGFLEGLLKEVISALSLEKKQSAL